MNENIKVSVIIPVHNSAQYLTKCIESMLNQTLKEIEIICVDDGSTDESLAIIKNYKKLDSRIKILTQENKYAGVARNNGMEIAKGEYLFFLDSDDFSSDTLLEKVYFKGKDNRYLCNIMKKRILTQMQTGILIERDYHKKMYLINMMFRMKYSI